MRWSTLTSTAVLATVLTLGSQGAYLSAQEVPAHDFRSRAAYTPDDLANALFPPSAPQVRTRGIGPSQSIASLPVRPAVTLNVRFAPNSDAIPASSHQELNKLGTVLAWPQYNEYRVELAGHTDNQGSEHLNRALSEKRVQSIKHYLVKNFQVSNERITAVGYGSSRPIASNDTPDGRSQNRRVEVVNLGRAQ
ncbi:MAG: OmpA family protein [Candidatus Tectimicrobiota bacterium]